MSENRNVPDDPNRQVLPSTRIHALAVLKKFNPTTAQQLISDHFNTPLPDLLTMANAVLDDKATAADPMEPALLTQETLQRWVKEFEDERTQKVPPRDGNSSKGKPQLPRLRFSDLQAQGMSRYFALLAKILKTRF